MGKFIIKRYTIHMAIKQEEKLIFKAILPEQLRVEIHKADAGETGYWAKVKEIPCYSQGENFQQLFDILTKAIYAYYNVPEKLISELGTYLPVEELQRKLAEENPPKKYTLDEILPRVRLQDINQLQRVA
jgi:predicted RNase H-like HicB family nuclease